MCWNGVSTGTSAGDGASPTGMGRRHGNRASAREPGVFTGTGQSLGHQWRVGRLRGQDGCYSGRPLYFNLKMNLDLGLALKWRDFVSQSTK